MDIIIDCRETKLYQECAALLEKYNLSNIITLSSGNLPIGDIIIKSNSIESVIIERKSINDLASSINDGRYKEQSFRLHATNVANHNVIYLIEGNLSKYIKKYGRIDKTALYSALVSINYYKGFSVIRSDNVEESAEYIIRYANKIHKNEKLHVKPFYANASEAAPVAQANASEAAPAQAPASTSEAAPAQAQAPASTSESAQVPADANAVAVAPAAQTAASEGASYASVIKRIKKDNINRDTIHYIWLSQLPYVSNKIAEVILKTHKTIWELRENLKINPGCLDKITLITTTGKTRMIGKNIVDTIKTHLLE